MDNLLFRCLLIFSILSDLKVHGIVELSKKLEVSKRTVNNDVRELKSIIGGFGVSLNMNPDGYSLEVIDSERFEFYKMIITVSIMQNPIVKGKPESYGRNRDILRILFTSSGKVTIDDVCDELHVARETIRSDYKSAKEMLASYNLKLSVNDQKESIQGAEFHKRLCMVNLYFPLYNLYSSKFIVKLIPQSDEYNAFRIEPYNMKFFSMFDINATDDLLHRLVIKDTVRDSGRMLKTNAEQMYAYINLSQNRINQGHMLEFLDSDSQFLRDFNEYRLSKQVMEILIPVEKKEYVESESLGMTLFLLMYMDLGYQDDLENDYSAVYSDAADLSARIGESISRQWHFPIAAIAEYSNIMISFLIPLLIQIRFDAAGYYRNFLKINQMDYYADPFSGTLSLCASALIEERISPDRQLSRYNYCCLAKAISNVICFGKRKLPGKRIAVYSQYGKTSAEAVAQKIGEFIPSDMIRKIFTCQPGENDSDSYDLMVVQTNYWVGRKEKHIQINSIPTYEQLSAIYQALSASQSEAERIKETFNCSVTCEKRTERRKDEFIGHISEELFNGTMKQEMKRFSRMFYYQNHIIVLLPEESLKKSLFRIFEFSNGIVWSKKSVTYVVLVSTDCHGSINRGKQIQEMLYQISIDGSIVSSLAKEAE